ncbi:MAG: M50 family metallopeptidase [bacterium]|nr:M50 family metallopeptidase [bacterium]
MKEMFMKIVNVIILLLSFGYIGFRCAQMGISPSKNISVGSFVIVIAAFVIVYLIQIILHEAGHLVAGLLSGYEFVSFRIGSIVWVKNKEQKIELRRMMIQGTGGQCLMCPPAVAVEECPYKLYHAMGGLVNIITGGIALALAMVLPHNLVTFCIFEEFGIIGIALGLTNLLPSKSGGIQNDGYNLLDLDKNILAKKCMNLVLTMNALLTVADSYDDLPEPIVNDLMSMDFKQMDLSNSSIANAFIYQTALLYVNGAYEKEYELVKYIADNSDILQIFRNEAKCECLFYEIITGASKEEIKKRYDKSLQRYIKATMIYPSRQRLMYAYYKLYEKNDAKAEACMKALEKMIDTYMIKADARHELQVAKNLEQISI